MKKYVLDKVLVPVFGLGILFAGYALDVWSRKTMILVLVYLSAGFCILYWRVLILPLDLIFGKRRAQGFFLEMAKSERAEWNPKKSICTWRFVIDNKPCNLVVPRISSAEELEAMKTPPDNQLIWITYYRFSHLLLGFDETNDE